MSSQLLESMWQDVKYALRTMRKHPVFTGAVVFTLAMGIGATTGMFSIIATVLLKPLAFWEPDRLVLVVKGATLIKFDEMKKSNQSFGEIGAFAVGLENLALSGVAEPEVLNGARISWNFLHILGVNPVLGRSFNQEEDRPGAPAVAMISAELWHRRFGGDPLIVGKTVVLAGFPHSIIGVLPPKFQFPMAGADVWLPRPSELSVIPLQMRPRSPILSIFGRLKLGADIQQASAELKLFNQQYSLAHPEMLDAKRTSGEPARFLKDELVSDIGSKLWMLFGAVGFVLLIVCANTASLLLARATSRSREFAVQAAIGAGRGRIIRQLLVECMLMACLGGALGVALSAWGLNSVSSVTFLDLPRAGEIRMDRTALAFAAGLSIFTGLLFGMVPSLAASRPDLSAVLRASGEGALGAGSKPVMRFSPRGLLVVGQVALSTVLLIAAMLLIESLVRLNRVNPGFQSASLLTMKIALSPIRYDTDQKKAKFYEELVQRTESLPGVRSAAVALTLPMTGFIASRVQPLGWISLKPDDLPISIVQDITPEYFRTMKIALKRGREFTARDNTESVPVVVINESLARLFWTAYPGGQDPIGQHILLGSNPQPKEIVGISADVRQAAKDEEPRPGVYIPCAQKPPQSAMLAVRTAGNPLSLANAVRNQVLNIDRDQPVSEVASMEEVVEASEGQLRLMMRLLGVLAVAATFLSAAGLYAVVSYSVIQRTRELGIRRALGAQSGDIIYLVVGHGLGLSLAGVVLGVGAAFVVTGVMKGMLFQVSAADPATFGGISILFIVISMVASYIPARRAVAINPLIALRVG